MGVEEIDNRHVVDKRWMEGKFSISSERCTLYKKGFYLCFVCGRICAGFEYFGWEVFV